MPKQVNHFRWLVVMDVIISLRGAILTTTFTKARKAMRGYIKQFLQCAYSCFCGGFKLVFLKVPEDIFIG